MLTMTGIKYIKDLFEKKALSPREITMTSWTGVPQQSGFLCEERTVLRGKEGLEGGIIAEGSPLPEWTSHLDKTHPYSNACL